MRWIQTSTLAVALVLGAARTARAQEDTNLLRDRAPIQVQGVQGAERLTDGTAAPEGSFWWTDLTARFSSNDSFVVYDLGSEQQIGAVWLQGDNDDVYTLALSNDGQRFDVAWRADPTGDPGQRARYSNALHASGRYVRISADGGDRSFSLSEVQVFSKAPEVFPPRPAVREGRPVAQAARDNILLLGLSLVALVVLAYRGMSRWWAAALFGATAIAAWMLLWPLAMAFPLGQQEVSLVRGTLAGVALAVLLREAFTTGRFAAHRGVALSVLGIAGIASIAAFYNLGHPQFWDEKRGTGTFIHYLDLRQYYTTAKYFRELGYTGMYAADVAAYLEDHPGATIDTLGGRPMRDLETLQISTIASQRSAIESIKARFSPARWEAYKKDVRYFRRVMGVNDFFVYLQDMGGNATPVWMSLAHLLFSGMPPSHGGFMATALLDLVLLAGTFAAIGRVFGLRTMFICMVVFGANDFIMYGTNWAGATLRHDWLAYLGLAACALRREKWALGGALLALSAMIRAFPAIALLAGTLPALWSLWDHVRVHRRLPRIVDLSRQPIARVWLGALAALAVLFLFSVIVLPASAWGDWLRKVSQLSSDPHASHISLRSLIAGWEADQGDVLRARLPIYLAAAAGYVALVALAARNKRIDQAAMLGLCLVPVLMYPANYYIHLVFLLPLVAADLVVWISLLGMCSAQYFTVLVTDRGLHFYLASALLFATLTVMLGSLVARQPFVARYLSPPPDSPL